MKFAHIREKDTRGNLQQGGFTIAYDVYPNINGGQNIQYSVARCNPKDNFCKKIGREIAEGRYVRGQVAGLNLPQVTNREIINVCATLERDRYAHVIEVRNFTKCLKKFKPEFGSRG